MSKCFLDDHLLLAPAASPIFAPSMQSDLPRVCVCCDRSPSSASSFVDEIEAKLQRQSLFELNVLGTNDFIDNELGRVVQ